METNKQSVPHLLAPNMPADRGLTGLGLLMQLFGTAFMALGAFFVMMPMLLDSPTPQKFSILLIGASSIVRSAMHRQAGTGLLYGSPKGNIAQTKRYIVVAVVQSLLVFAVLKDRMMTSHESMYVLILLLAWPMALSFALRLPQFKNVSELPHAEDLGFESAAVLMTIFGIAGSLLAGSILLGLLREPLVRSDVIGLLVTSVFGLLLVRSVMHARAGLLGVSGINTDKATETTNSYIRFGIASAIIIGAMLCIQMLLTARGAIFQTQILVILATYLLFSWPSILRSFFTDRNFALILDEEKHARRTPDNGLTTLGWLLFALGVYGLSFAIADSFFSGQGVSARQFLLGAPLDFGKSPMWQLLTSALQILAGLSLITMHKQHKAIVTVYGVAALAVAGDMAFTIFPSLSNGHFDTLSSALLITPLVVPLTVSLGAIKLVHRRHAPDAKARIVD